MTEFCYNINGVIFVNFDWFTRGPVFVNRPKQFSKVIRELTRIPSWLGSDPTTNVHESPKISDDVLRR